MHLLDMIILIMSTTIITVTIREGSFPFYEELNYPVSFRLWYLRLCFKHLFHLPFRKRLWRKLRKH